MINRFRIVSRFACVSATALCAWTAAPATYAQQSDERVYDLPAQDLATALRTVAKMSGRSIIASADIVTGKTAPALRGRFTSDKAVTSLLTGSGLRAQPVGAGLVIVAAGAPVNMTVESAAPDIVITGTSIRGTAPVGAPLVSIDRAEIDRSGHATTQQVLQAIPQNFGGGPNEANLGAGVRNGAGSNSAYGASVNLRGLGSSSTLVLFNGVRPALGGLGGVFADLSLVSSSAIERIEVLTDGASAVYGSDAVAGVVNIRFRDRFEGAETRLRYGTADGDFDEIQASQLVGLPWATGNLVAGYQYYQRGALAARDRAFATEDLRPFGGPDYRSIYANPGTIIAADGRIFAIPRGQNGMALQPADLIPGVTNREDARALTDILPRQRTHSLYLAGRQELGDTLSLYAQGLFADRRYEARFLPFSNSAITVPTSNPYYVDPIGTGQPVRVQYSFARDLGPNLNTGEVQGYSGVLGLTKTFGPWSIDVHGSYGHQRENSRTDNIPNRARLAAALADPNPATAYNVFGDGAFTNPETIDVIRGSYGVRERFSVASFAVKADGPLLRLPAGDIKLAIGGEFRAEHFTYQTLSDTISATPTPGTLPGLPGPRHITAGYAELFVPIFGADARIPGFERLTLSLAGRIEDYNDVGTTRNPRVGLNWLPIEGITLRGSYGQSFRAPSFTELIGSAIANYQPFTVADPQSPTGQTTVLGLFGYAPNIGPERAKTWTIGIELEPRLLSGMRASLNYFDIAYRDRIGTATQDVFNFLANRAVFGGLVSDNPDPALIQSYYSSPSFNNPLNIPATAIAAILDGRVRNLSTVRQNGIDVDIAYTSAFAGGNGEIGLAGTWLFNVNQQLTASAPAIDVVGTLGNPVDLRLRGRASWSSGAFDLAAFVNHVAGYENRAVVASEPVDSWTTIDAHIAYTLPERLGLGDLRFALSATNLFDRAPPYVNNRTPNSALGYDPDNASPVGRLVALQVTKIW